MEIDQTYEVVALDDDCPLKEHPQNPKQSADEIIEDSIDNNGWYGAIIAQKSTAYILAGNGRYRTALKRKATHIPVIWRDVDDETALRILLVDNKSADAGTYDEDMLHQVLSSLVSLDGTGYGDALHTLEKRLAAEAEEAAANSVAQDAPDPEPDPTPAGPSDPSDGSPESPADVPKDQYTPDFGIMLTCESEEDQQDLYEALVVLMDEGADGDDDRLAALHGRVDEPRKMRVVAV